MSGGKFNVISAGQGLTTYWKKFRIKLADFQDWNSFTLDSANITKLVFTIERGNSMVSSGAIYIDEVQFEMADTTPPAKPLNVAASSLGNWQWRLSCTASSAVTDPTMAYVRFEYSSDGVTWYSFTGNGSDYDTSDSNYSATGYGGNTYPYAPVLKVRAVAVDLDGNTTASDTLNVS